MTKKVNKHICQCYSVLQCSPHNSNPLNKNFRLLRRNPGSHRRNNTNNSNGKIRLNRRSKILYTSWRVRDSFRESGCRFFSVEFLPFSLRSPVCSDILCART